MTQVLATINPRKAGHHPKKNKINRRYEMITLYRNLDTKQPVQFSSVEAMKKTILKNPFAYDGLAFYAEVTDEDAMINLLYVKDGKEAWWEVEEFPTYESSSYTLEEAVEVFAGCLSELGIY
jgi:hypothetical protein